MDDENLL
jgi:magnesium-transporting ATPase (P-type)